MMEESWYNPIWFSPARLESFHWENGWALWLLALIPLMFLLRWALQWGTRTSLTLALTKNTFTSSPVSLLRFIPQILLAIAVIATVLALARPQTTNEKVEQWTEGIDIMLVIDISESMQIQDFKPNRLKSAKNVAQDFINGRFQDRIGLVVFSGDAYSLSPLTTDYDLLNSYIESIDFDMIQAGGTAIGSALGVAINRMKESDTKSKVLILISDGDNNAGNIDPITAAELAHAFDIKIYTIAIGREGRVPFGRDAFGRTRYVENTLDETNLRRIADIGEGEFYRVSDNEALEKVFALIDEYEKAEIKETRFKDTADYYSKYLMLALVLLLLWLITKSTFLSNALLD